MKKQWGFILAVLMIVVVMGGCGGGGESGGGAANTVSGVAAAGAPLVGTVSLKDSSTPAKVSSPVTIGTDGAFTVNVDGLKPPYILKADGTAGGTNYTLYSFAAAPGIANINPIANLAVANAAGGADLAALYAASLDTTMQAIASNLAKAVSDIQAKLQPLLAAYNVTANPVSGNYTANHLGLDGMLDMVKVAVSTTGTVTITNKLTNAIISSGSVISITNWTLPQNILLPPVVVNVTPETAMVNVSGTATFAALVSNSTNTQVTWSVVEAGGGTITSSGVYTAPATIGTATTKVVTVKATSGADPTKFDTAVVTVTTGPVVTLSPTSATVTTSGTKTFTATVSNSTNTQVTWSVVEAGGGTITQSGVYTAPSTSGAYHVKAASSADSTKYATATVTVTSVGVTISPSSTTVTTNGTKSFAASVSNSANTQVTWSVLEAGGGTITSSGFYTPPSTTGTYHVKAVSSADPTKSATATVTVTAAPQPFPIGTWVGPHNITIKVNALVDTMGTDSYYSGSVSYPAFSGGIVTISGAIFGDMGGIDYVQNNALAVTAMSATGSSVTSFAFQGDGTIYMNSPITSYSGLLIIVSNTPGYSYSERATFVKQ